MSEKEQKSKKNILKNFFLLLSGIAAFSWNRVRPATVLLWKAKRVTHKLLIFVLPFFVSLSSPASSLRPSLGWGV